MRNDVNITHSRTLKCTQRHNNNIIIVLDFSQDAHDTHVNTYSTCTTTNDAPERVELTEAEAVPAKALRSTAAEDARVASFMAMLWCGVVYFDLKTKL